MSPQNVRRGVLHPHSVALDVRNAGRRRMHCSTPSFDRRVGRTLHRARGSGGLERMHPLAIYADPTAPLHGHHPLVNVHQR